jgi:hypothetical protein
VKEDGQYGRLPKRTPLMLLFPVDEEVDCGTCGFRDGGRH